MIIQSAGSISSLWISQATQSFFIDNKLPEFDILEPHREPLRKTDQLIVKQQSQW